VAKVRFERRSFATALLTYLQTAGWNVTTIQEQFIKDIPLEIPAVGVYFIPSKVKELQMGRTVPSYIRPIQVDVYMESESRVEAILDDIGDFMDLESITVKDTNNNVLAYMISDSESILLDSPPPLESTPTLIRWRGIAKCVYEVNYID